MRIPQARKIEPKSFVEPVSRIAEFIRVTCFPQPNGHLEGKIEHPQVSRIAEAVRGLVNQEMSWKNTK
jgi:hypothetical protein